MVAENREREMQANKSNINLSALEEDEVDLGPDDDDDTEGVAKQGPDDEREQQQQDDGGGANDDGGGANDDDGANDDPEEKRLLVAKLRAYITQFPHMFPMVDWRSFHSRTVTELRVFMEHVRYTIGMKNDNSAIKFGINQGIGVLETIATSFTPLKLSGLQANVAGDEELQDIIKELSIEYGSFEYVPPEKRFLNSLAKVVYVTHAVNRAKEQENEVELAKVSQESVPNDIVDESADL